MDTFASSWRKVNSGVPQRSVFGPFLFLIYLTDLTNALQPNPKLFADDTSLFSTVNFLYHHKHCQSKQRSYNGQ